MTNIKDGKVLKLYITLNDENKTRLPSQTVEVDSNGIKGDKFYAKDSQRSILITSLESYDMAKENNIEIETGVLGENILIDINPYGLKSGDQIQIGDVVLEITQNCTLCKGLTTINSKLPKLLKNDRGIFAKVINNATSIKVEDKVKILNH
jgi:MOSC domain-containing protein YiiM